MLNISIVQIIVIGVIGCLYTGWQMAWQKKQSQT